MTQERERVHSQASEEARTLARKIVLPMIERSEDCRMPLSVAQRMSVPTIAAFIDEALDRVSRERTRQALERAATKAQEIADKHFHRADVAADPVMRLDRCEAALQVAAAIRALLSDGESVASAEKEE